MRIAARSVVAVASSPFTRTVSAAASPRIAVSAAANSVRIAARSVVAVASSPFTRTVSAAAASSIRVISPPRSLPARTIAAVVKPLAVSELEVPATVSTTATPLAVKVAVLSEVTTP